MLPQKFREGLQQGAGFFSAVLLLSGTAALLAQTYNSFSAGDLISASQINDNFSYLRNRVESPLPFAESSSSGNWFDTSGNWTNATNLSVTVTTNGSPVWVGLVADGTNVSMIGAYDNTTHLPRGQLRLTRDGSSVAHTLLAMRAHDNTTPYQYVHLPCSAFWHIDNPGAGTYTYTLQGRADGANGVNRVNVLNCKLIAARFNEI